MSKPKKQPLSLNTSKLNSNSILSTTLPKKQNKSLINNDINSYIQLSQTQINFINTQQNQIYEIFFTILNISQKSIKVKIKRPKSEYLNITVEKEKEKDTNLAPGLEKKIVVTYNSQINQEIKDKINLYYEDLFDIEVPICVFPCVYHLNYQPFINLGLLKTGVTKQYHLNITNKGNNIAEIRLQPQIKGAKAIIQPTCLTIQPNLQQFAILYLSSIQSSQFEGTIQIYPQLLGQSYIEIIGSFCDYSRYISDSTGKQISQLCIPYLFGGQKIIKNFFIVNNTPKPCQFRLIRKRGTNLDEKTILLTPQQFGRDDEQKNIIFSQIQGQIEPYNKKQITCEIIAKIDQHDQQLFCNYTSGKIKLLPYDHKQWCYTISTTFKDEQNNKNLLIKGQSFIPKLFINTIFFKFGQCYVRTRQQKILKIQNLSDRTVHIVVEKSKNYCCIPSSFEIPKDGQKQVLIEFFPKIVGDLQQICYIKVASFSFPLKMFGKGIFTKQSIKKLPAHKNQSIMNQSQGIQINVTDMQKTIKQQQISIINQKSIYIQQNSKISATNFDMVSLSTKIKPENKNIIKKKTIKNKNGKQIIIDILNFNADEEVEQYTILGRNSQQDRMVSRQLNLNQFKNIPVGPVIIDFGQIFVLSAQKKTFHICNFNLKPISIQIQTKDNQQFEKTSRHIQILPGESHGGLKIIFQALREGKFKHQLQYVINGRHFFDILAVGTAILPTLKLSKTEFKFVAGQDDHKFEKKQLLVLNNPYPYEVQYNFLTQKQSTFKFQPSKGKINPNSKQNICIIHNFLGSPEGGGKIQQNIRITIKNGRILDIKCISIVPQCSIICKPNQCNFKQISICKSYQMKFSIKNSCKNFTIFKIVPNKEIQEQIKITTTKTILAIDQISEVTVKLMSQKQQIIDSGLNIIVRGGRKLFVSVKANVIIPKIKIEIDQINFGSRPVDGNPTSKQITLINQSLIPVELELLLPNQSFLSKCLSIKPQNNQLSTVFPVKQIKQRKSKSYQIKIAKKCKAHICLQFQPEQVKDYKFTLPLYLAGNYQSNIYLQKNIICHSLKNKLLTDLKQLDFGKTIIEQSLDNLLKSVTFTLINPLEDDVQWWSNQKNIQPFSLEIKKGVIKGNSQIKIKAFFCSQNPGIFQKQFQFFVNNSDFQPSRPYLKLPIKATANYPQIYFDRPYVILPTVRLNQQSVSKFQIINGGYQNLKLRHSISQQYSNIDLNIKYINGCNLGITKKSITIMVSFKSQRPISFTLKIQFYDNHNRIFSIFVSGTADNSLYVLPQSYWQPDSTQVLSKSTSFLTTFLNSLGFVQGNLYDFPTCLIDNDYQNFNKLLEYQTTQPEKLKPNLKKLIKIQQKYQYFVQIVKMLKSDGAFLSQIRPQFLMNQLDYLQILKIKSQNMRIFTNYKILSSQLIKQQHIKSWIILIYQIFRIYSKVPNKKKLQNNDIWSQMLQKQKIIINWLEQCYQIQANLQQIKPSNQFNDLSDGQMLSALITKYTNIKILEVYGKSCNVVKEKQKRCRKIVEILSQIGIAPGVKVQDLLRSKPVQMLVFLQRLYMILPFYLQKGDPITFSCLIGQSLTKSVEIKNPSKYVLTYIAKIQGSKAYVIQNQQQFKIQPKQKHEVLIKYISNIDIQKVNATLTLTGKTQKKFTPCTFIFVLKNINLGRISQKSIQVTSQLYQSYQFQINIKNNFNTDATLNIEITSINPKIVTKNLFCTTPQIKIKKDQTLSIPFIFLPFMLQTHKFLILFKDPKVGQFQYDLTGLVDMPQIMPDPLRLNQNFYTNKIYSVQLSIPQKNQQIVKARKQVEAYLQKIQRKIQPQTIQARRLSSASVILQRFLYPTIKQQNYSLSLVPQTDMVILKTTTLTFDPWQQQNTISAGKKINIQINMKMPVKQAPIYLIMKNTSNTDIRRYKILINSVYKPLRYQLQIKIPINQTITQPLPLINITNQNNLFNVTFITNQINITKNIFIFNNQKDVMIKPKQQYLVNLTFIPKLQQVYTGLLKIENISNGQLLQYQINAIGQQPIADNIRFETKTGQIKKLQIKLPYTKPQKCTVTKCTLPPTNIKYEKIFWYNNQSSCYFNFTYYTKVPGIYQGKIYLQDQLKLYAYNITIAVNQNIQEIIQIRSIQRIKKEIQINLDKGYWQIQHNDFNLIVPQQVQIKQNGIFKFQYMGNRAGQYQSYLMFKNQTIGYMKYVLKIRIQQHPQTVISNLQVQLGKIHTFTIKLQNPQNTQITVTGNCTNIETFYYNQQNSFTIGGKSCKQIKLMYRPSCLQIQRGKIYFTGTNNLKWKYDINGCGILQKQQQIKQITGQIGTQVIQTINFINPFKKAIYIHLFLQNQNQNEDKKDHEQFQFINKNNKFMLNYLENIYIPIKIICNTAKLYKCKVKILINQKIYWKYHIYVNIISKVNDDFKMFKLPARNKKEITTVFNLPHLSKNTKNGQKFRCVITAEDVNQQNLLSNNCRVVKQWQQLQDNKVSFLLNFLSYRPFICPFLFQIYHQNNCKWIFKAQVQYLVPPPDDQFQILTQINKATSVMFRLSNRIKVYAKYKAYFTSDSDMEFSISPKTGDLQPFGRQGSQFQVTFAPTQYKNSWHGKIIIQTQDSYWSYLVKGNLPHYVPPVGKSNLTNSIIKRSLPQ